MSDDKFTQLEIALAHQDRQIQDLHEMLNKQWKEIDILKLKLDKAQRQIIELNTSSQENDSSEPMTVTEIAAAEKPPHY